MSKKKKPKKCFIYVIVLFSRGVIWLIHNELLEWYCYINAARKGIAKNIAVDKSSS